jgi:hypothetical protein
MMQNRLLPLLVLSMLIHSCTTPPDNANIQPGSFGYDLQFLGQHDTGLVVLKNGDARVAVSPKYQAKVFTSTASGDDGPSFGWIHYKAFDGPANPHMNAYGGENRLWLGPEGGKFSLFFTPGAKMEFTNWKTPAAFDTEPWTVTLHSDTVVDLRKDMQLTNYAGTRLSLSIDRSIILLNRTAIDSTLNLTPDTAVHAVGYRTFNILTNTGAQAWTESTGMPCLWLLDMFNPSPSTVIVVPYASAPGDTSKPATMDYFGEIPADRVKYDGQTLFFRADGKSRGKLGMHPHRARPVIGSYDALHHVLTICQFDVDTTARYLNQEWNTVKPPFSGDAVNAYNDGPLANGSQMGPFYELESVSPAAFLSAGQAQVHKHSVFHFTGAEAALDPICRKVLGVGLEKVKSAF